eukprot:2520100-Rhodomonas_salina.1
MALPAYALGGTANAYGAAACLRKVRDCKRERACGGWSVDGYSRVLDELRVDGLGLCAGCGGEVDGAQEEARRLRQAQVDVYRVARAADALSVDVYTEEFTRMSSV